jgi:hypothetical protein
MVTAEPSYIEQAYSKNLSGFMDTLDMVCYCVLIDPNKDDKSYDAVERWQLMLLGSGYDVVQMETLLHLGSDGLMTCSCDNWLHCTFCKESYLFALQRNIILGFPKLRDPNHAKSFGARIGRPCTIQRGKSAALTRDRTVPSIQEEDISMDDLVTTLVVDENDIDSEDEAVEADKSKPAAVDSDDDANADVNVNDDGINHMASSAGSLVSAAAAPQAAGACALRPVICHDCATLDMQNEAFAYKPEGTDLHRCQLSRSCQKILCCWPSCTRSHTTHRCAEECGRYTCSMCCAEGRKLCSVCFGRLHATAI